MILLEQLQKKLNADYEVFNILCGCDKIIANDGDKKAITAYLQMAIHFYGKERIATCIENYSFERVKKFIESADIEANNDRTR